MRVRLQHERLAEELAKRPISHNRWAQMLGLSSGHLSDLVNGRRRFPAAATRRKLLEGLDLPFEELFEIQQPVRRSSPSPSASFIDASRDRPHERPARRGGDNGMGHLLKDLSYAVRGLLRSPAFSCAAILTLAIGIGSNTALFSIVDSILWKPYPYPESDRLVVLQSATQNRGWGSLSFPDVQDLGNQSQLLEGSAAWDWEPYGLSGDGEPARIGGARVSANFFDVLGVQPIAGRTFLPGEDTPGAERVMVISEGLWRSHFGGRDIVGSTVLINAQPTTIVGVLPAGAEYPNRTRLWVPMRFDPESAPRGSNFLGSMARLRDGVELQALQTEIQNLGERLQSAYPEANRDRVYRAIALREALTSDVGPITLSLLGILTFVLLIVCANVANLLLARGATRRREVAIRRSLGASNRRLAQLLLAESFILTAVGGCLGFVLGWLGSNRIAMAVADQIPPWVRTDMDGRVVVFTIAATGLAGLLFSLFPLLQSLRFGLFDSLRSNNQRASTGARGSRLRSSLVVAEVALSLILIVGAGLMVKSLLDLTSVDPGFEPQGSLTVGLDLLSKIEAEPAERALLFGSFLERFASLPGVEAVGGIDHFPLKGRSSGYSISAAEQTREQAQQNPTPLVSQVTSGYLEAIGIPLLRGRDFETHTNAPELEPVIASHALAKSLWPDEGALGQRLRFGYTEVDEETRWMTVVGVAGDINHQSLDQRRPAHLYLPYATRAPSRMTVILRYSGDTAALVAAVRAATAEVDPNQPLHEVMTTEEVIADSVWQWHFFSTLAWTSGLIALLLAVVGIYGVMTYTVSQRTSEVGVRMALGARRQQVIAMILRQGSRLVLLGIAIALPVSLGLGKVLSGLLYSVRTFEPMPLAGAILVLILVALPAIAIPARRAAKVDPASSLRAE